MFVHLEWIIHEGTNLIEYIVVREEAPQKQQVVQQSCNHFNAFLNWSSDMI